VSDILDYYSARADEYEQVYAKPERQDDLGRLKALIPSFFVGRRVLEVACGTGYWTRLIAQRAAGVIACDLSPQVLAHAIARQPAESGTQFVRAITLVWVTSMRPKWLLTQLWPKPLGTPPPGARRLPSRSAAATLFVACKSSRAQPAPASPMNV